MRHPGACYLLYLVALGGATGCTTTYSASPAVIEIATARALPPASRAMVEGVVTADAGAIDDGFALQDASGGIYVINARTSPLKVGEHVRVEGSIVAPNNQKGIDPSAITRMGLATAALPLAQLRTGEVGANSEGRLVAVRGKMTGEIIDDQPWGWKLYIDDGSGALLIFVASSTRIDLKHLRAGMQLKVTGFNGRYETHTEVLPRGPRDISLAAD